MFKLKLYYNVYLNQVNKRGGDEYCIIFCSNRCNNNRSCNYKTGICECKLNYLDIDCDRCITPLTTYRLYWYKFIDYITLTNFELF